MSAGADACGADIRNFLTFDSTSDSARCSSSSSSSSLSQSPPGPTPVGPLSLTRLSDPHLPQQRQQNPSTLSALSTEDVKLTASVTQESPIRFLTCVSLRSSRCHPTPAGVLAHRMHSNTSPLLFPSPPRAARSELCDIVRATHPRRAPRETTSRFLAGSQTRPEARHGPPRRAHGSHTRLASPLRSRTPAPSQAHHAPLKRVRSHSPASWRAPSPHRCVRGGRGGVARPVRPSRPYCLAHFAQTLLRASRASPPGTSSSVRSPTGASPPPAPGAQQRARRAYPSRAPSPSLPRLCPSLRCAGARRPRPRRVLSFFCFRLRARFASARAVDPTDGPGRV